MLSMISGLTDKEGIWWANYKVPDTPNNEIWREFLDTFDDVAPKTFGVHGSNAKDSAGVLKKIVEFYGLTDMEQVHTYVP